jgi:hypothetical protein
MIYATPRQFFNRVGSLIFCCNSIVLSMVVMHALVYENVRQGIKALLNFKNKRASF